MASSFSEKYVRKTFGDEVADLLGFVNPVVADAHHRSPGARDHHGLRMDRDPHPDAIEAEYVEHSNAPTPLLPAQVGDAAGEVAAGIEGEIGGRL